MQEIVKIVKETDPDCIPIFVAKDLNKLPPVTFDHIDVTTFLKEMLLLKKEVASLRRENLEVPSLVTNEEMESLKSEIQQLKDLVQGALSSNERENAKEILKQTTNTITLIPSITINNKEVEEIFSDSIDFERAPRTSQACDALRRGENESDTERAPSPVSSRNETAIVERQVDGGRSMQRAPIEPAAAAATRA